MRIARLAGILVLVLVAAAPLVAHAKSSAGKSAVDSALGIFLQKRVSLMYGQGETSDFRSGPGLTAFPKLETYGSDITVGFPLGIRLGFSETFTQQASASFAGLPEKRAEAYITMFEYGVLFSYPIGRIAPYVGAGGLNGTMSLSDPTTRPNDTWLAAFEFEQSSVWGHYYQLGLDIKFIEGLALRLGGQHSIIETARFSNVQNQQLKFDHTKWQVGFVTAY